MDTNSLKFKCKCCGKFEETASFKEIVKKGKKCDECNFKGLQKVFRVKPLVSESKLKKRKEQSQQATDKKYKNFKCTLSIS